MKDLRDSTVGNTVLRVVNSRQTWPLEHLQAGTVLPISSELYLPQTRTSLDATGDLGNLPAI